jgi:hypothetical protein
VVALVAMAALVLLAVSVTVVALGHGITAMMRVARQAAEPAIGGGAMLSLALQPAIVSSKEPARR